MIFGNERFAIPRCSTSSNARGRAIMDMTNSTTDILRIAGCATVCVGLAWAVQILGFGDVSNVGRFLWTMAAATVSGAGVGLVVASNGLMRHEVSAIR